jgi:hypothetical protein
MSRAFSSQEVADWLRLNSQRYDVTGKTRVADYVASGIPQWGIVVKDNVAAGTVNTLVLFIPTKTDGSLVAVIGPLHITLVDDNAPIIAEIQKAPFKSPDDTGFWDNFWKETTSVFGTGFADVSSLVKWAVVGIIAVLIILYVPRSLTQR